MTDVIERLKKESLRVRKERGPLSAFTVFVLAEVAKVGKAKNRDTTNDEAISVMKKILETAKSNTSVISNEFELERLKAEIKFIEDILPKMVSTEEVKAFLTSKFGTDFSNKGAVMKAVKEEFGALVDMKAVNSLLV